MASAIGHYPIERRHGGNEPPDGGFDFVHLRFIASTAGNPEGLLQAIRLAKPGALWI